MDNWELAMKIWRLRAVLPALAALGLAGATAVPGSSDSPIQKRPNIVVILADDAALMEFGVYGGEAKTPNIDMLAERGALFTQYRASPLCSPSRAMLLTGMDNHLTGLATIPEVLPEEQKGRPGYSMALEPGVLTLADRLKRAGYRTLMTGKWHLGEKSDEMPQAHGFDHSFALAASGADNWEDRPYIPYYKDAPWFENGAETSLPKEFYSSRFIVDKMIEYLDETESDRPFFAYLPFQAIHVPVQAPQEFVERYKGRYNAGWEALREERHARAQQLGLVRQGAPLADLPDAYRRWKSLSKDDQKLYAARMEVYPAMMEAMDHNIGRLIDHLKAKGQYDNTIFVVTSDNGPEPARGDDNALLSAYFSQVGYDVGAKNLGGRGYWGFIGPEWAAAVATPGAWYKFYATEGGVRVPLIIAGPGIGRSRIDSPAMIADIAPTLLEWSATTAPDDKAKPMTGRSLMPVLTGKADSVYAKDDVRVIEVSGNAALYKGDYKITRSVRPAGDGKWRLFNLAQDPGETTDLAANNPAMLKAMLADYDAYAKRVGVLEMPEGYDSLKQINANTASHMLDNYPWLYAVLAGIILLAGALVWLLVRFIKSLFGQSKAVSPTTGVNS